MDLLVDQDTVELVPRASVLHGHSHGTQPRRTVLILATVVRVKSFRAFKNGTEVFLNPDVMCAVLESGE